MILQSGTRQTVAPYAASQITLDNPTPQTVRVRVGDAAPLEVKPHGQVLVPRALQEETLVECLGPGAVELSFLVTPQAAVDHPDYARLRERGLVGNAWRDAITEAWKTAFDKGAMGSRLNQFEPLTLANSTGIEAGQGFNRMCPLWDQGSRWADGNGRLDLTSLRLRDLPSARWTGDPVFSDDDRKVTFSMRFDKLRLDGKTTMTQRCCSGAFGWCWYTDDFSSWSDFVLTMDSVVLWFDAVVEFVSRPDPLIAVGDTRLEVQGARTIHFPGDESLPDWLKYLATDWPKLEEFRSATTTASEQALVQPAIRQTVQSLINSWLILNPATGTP